MWLPPLPVSMDIYYGPCCRLHYDPTTGNYSNTMGVQTRVPDFGGTGAVEYLDPHAKFIEAVQYYHAMVEHFVNKGYVRGKSIVAAPYDWRYSPSKHQVTQILSNGNCTPGTDVMLVGQNHFSNDALTLTLWRLQQTDCIHQLVLTASLVPRLLVGGLAYRLMVDMTHEILDFH